MSCVPQARTPWGWAVPPEECGCGALPDWDFRDCDLQPSGDELRDAVVASLFMNAKDDERSPAGGWWGAEFVGDGAGSRLWTLQGATANTDYVVRGERYIREALEWLRTSGAIASYRVSGDLIDGAPVFDVKLYGRSGDVMFAERFERLWNG